MSRRTPWPGGVLPDTYKRTYDPFVALAAAAAVTSTIRLGTGICMAVARDPIITAKEVASLDAISNGRFVFGIGYGWNAEEIEDHGVPFASRAAVLREKVLAMKAIWSGDEAGFQGERVIRGDLVVAQAAPAAAPADRDGLQGERRQLSRHR